MRVYRVTSAGWATVNRDSLPEGLTDTLPSLVLGLKDSARAGVFYLGGEYVVIATLAGSDTTALLVGNYQHLLRVLSDLSGIIGADLATRMHSDLQAQIDAANAQVSEMIQKHAGADTDAGADINTDAQPVAETPTPKFLRRTND